MKEALRWLFWSIILYAGFKVFIERTEEALENEPSYTAPCEDAIDYDWDLGRYICPEDTVKWMRHPNKRGWVLKKNFVPTERKRTTRLPMTKTEELMHEADDRGIQ